jgi:hypothetical protein
LGEGLAFIEIPTVKKSTLGSEHGRMEWTASDIDNGLVGLKIGIAACLYLFVLKLNFLFF